MPALVRRVVLVLFAAIFAPFLMASSCSDDEDSTSSTESEVVPEVEVLPVDSGEPDPDLNVDGLDLDGPMAPQEGDGSTPDEPSFEPEAPVEEEALPEEE